MPEAIETSNTQDVTFKQREMARYSRTLKSLQRLESIASKVGMKEGQKTHIVNAVEAIVSLNEKLLAKMPDDFTPPAASIAPSFQPGDLVNPTEEASVLYQKADSGLTVKEVVKLGGNESGKGAKTFLKCKRADGTFVTVPASHFE